ncbi:MAG: lactate utilization protein [Thermomicrobiales bacterium]|nr:lactate utilization protein [Thermomicrobiales bacterium]
MPDPFDDFRTILTAAAGDACRCTRSGLAETIAEMAPAATIWTRDDLNTVWPGLAVELEQAGMEVISNGSPAQVRDQPWGLTTARAAIAETGSVILHENRLEHRSVSLMTNALIVLVAMSALYSSLDDAGRILREIASDGTSYATLLSGPSRTADIERQLTIGVQGPGELYVIFVDEG